MTIQVQERTTVDGLQYAFTHLGGKLALTTPTSDV